MRSSLRLGLTSGLFLVLLAAVIGPGEAWAHVGAPYPVLLEEPVGPYLASALADPDVGKGTFFIQATSSDGSTVRGPIVVTIWVEPEDGHAPEKSYLAERQQTRYGDRYVAEIPFDAEGPWNARLEISGPAGTGETQFPVRVTPSGIGWLATLACLLPFVVLGGLWLRGTLRQRSAQKTALDKTAESGTLEGEGE